MKFIHSGLLICAIVALLTGCGNRQMSGSESGDRPLLRGVVVETVDASRYTYLKVDDNEAVYWVAVPRTTVTVGDRVTVPHGEEMTAFHSKALDRTFDRIYFTTGITLEENADDERPHQTSHDHIPGTRNATGTILETMDAQRYTYVLIATDIEKIWVASTRFDADVGDKVSAPIGLPMKDFYSKTLDRTFDLIYFTGFVRTLEKGGRASAR